MARVKPLSVEDLPPDLREIAIRNTERFGHAPSLFLTMARKPEIARAYTVLRDAIERALTIPSPLRLMMFHVMSASAGCAYCQAHSIRLLTRWEGVPPEKIAALWDYETSPLFDESERAALRFAQSAGAVPNAVTDEDVEALRPHFTEEQIVEMVAALAYGAFLNKINDTLATELEDPPREAAERILGPKGWVAGKHAAR